jgi:hypothetical protein
LFEHDLFGKPVPAFSDHALVASRTAYAAVIPRESGVSSTPQLLDSIASPLEYWITRFRG